MKINKHIPNEILNAATVILSQFVPGLSAEALLKALETYNHENKESSSSKKNPHPAEPNTCQDADASDLSLMSIDFYMVVNSELVHITFSYFKVQTKTEDTLNQD